MKDSPIFINDLGLKYASQAFFLFSEILFRRGEVINLNVYFNYEPERCLT